MNIKTLIVYDKSGTVLAAFNAASTKPPVGVPYIIVEIPDGVTIESVDVTTGTPVYSSNTVVTSEIDKINSKMDYIAMMESIDISVIVDVTLGTKPRSNISNIIDANEENHSVNYMRVYNYYMMDLWSITAVRNAINKWITSMEYNQIVKAKEDNSSYPDNTNKIPVVEI